MRKIIKYKDLKDINICPYRRIIIYSPFELPGFKNNAFNNYFKEDKLDEIINEYIKCLEKTRKDILPYLFIFNKCEVENEEFLKCSNWLIIDNS